MEGQGLSWEKRNPHLPASLRVLCPRTLGLTCCCGQADLCSSHIQHAGLRTCPGTSPFTGWIPPLLQSPGKSLEALVFSFLNLFIASSPEMWSSVHLTSLPSVNWLRAVSWPCVGREVLTCSFPRQGLLRTGLCYPEAGAMSSGLRVGLLGSPWLSHTWPPTHPSTGDVHQAEVRADEEGVRAKRALWLRDRAHHLQPLQQAVPVRQHGHGQGAAQVHGVQRAAREPDELGHRGGERARAPGEPQTQVAPLACRPSLLSSLSPHKHDFLFLKCLYARRCTQSDCPNSYSTLSLCLKLQSETGMIVGTPWICSLLGIRHLVKLLISSFLSRPCPPQCQATRNGKCGYEDSSPTS